MAVDKLVDSAQLNSDLTSIANAIRTKGETSASLAFPSGFVSAIEAIPSGGGGLDEFLATEYSVYENSTATSIAAYKFAKQRLTSVTFLACENIGEHAFDTCSYYLQGYFGLVTAYFPACKIIGEAAFISCTSLQNISFPECTHIGKSAFYGCNLPSAYFPKCVEVGPGAFAGQWILTASFPKCETIYDNAFQNCTKLTSISLPECKTISHYAFYCNTSLTALYLPKCEFIGSSVFSSCTSLSVVSLPKCTFIDQSAFVRCYNLISLYLLGSSIPTLGSYPSKIFLSTPISTYSTSAGTLGSIYVPASLYDAYKRATGWAYYSARFVSV